MTRRLPAHPGSVPAARLAGPAPALTAGVALALLVALAPAPLAAQGATMTIGGFVDTYWAWDLGRPPGHDRAYTTQAARHAEFNINLAMIDLELTGDHLRGRLALQAGTSVDANYLNEPTLGELSGGTLSRHLQEAFVGISLGERTWIDAGIFFAHTGSEQWISRDNLTYTRSLVAELSPYYVSGVKLTRIVRPNVTASLSVMNGWGIVSETNSDKSVGLRADWQVTRRLSLGYYNLIGNDEPDSAEARMRFYNGLTGRWTGDEFTLQLTIDGGRQNTALKDNASWLGASLLGRMQVFERWAVAGRVETFQDPDRVIATGAPAAFEVSGASIGIDYEQRDGIVWRSEYRTLRGTEAVFPHFEQSGGVSKINSVFVTSLSVTF